MRYIPHTKDEIQEMLQAIGVNSLDDLFSFIPDSHRMKKELNLPSSLSEMDLRATLHKLSRKNFSVEHFNAFYGGGAYHHYLPSVISQLINRGEFFTAYTPYQPEVSQGTLQAVFEYQTMICELTGMEVANASNYDASTASAEAFLMAHRINKKKKGALAKSLHPQYRKVIQTYLQRFGYEICEIDYGADGSLDLDDLEKKLDGDMGAVMVQSPNFFGVIEDLKKIKEKALDAITISITSEPLSLALLTTPGEADFDIAVLEGQSFGVGLNFGGPSLGIFATKQKYIRQMPGRVVGETVDVDGKRGYVLTFATREQHIRREKATSNICTNQGLCVLMASIYLSLMGTEGLCELAKINLSRAEYAKKELKKIGIKILFDGPTFNEFVVSLPNADSVLKELRKKDILGGLLLDKQVDGLNDAVLICVTEMNKKEDIDRLVEEIEAISPEAL